MERESSSDVPGLPSKESSPAMLDDLGINVTLNTVSDETLQRFCREAGIAYTNDRETTIENLRATAKSKMPEKTYQPYDNEEEEDDDDEHLEQEPSVNSFTPVNKRRSKILIEDPEDESENDASPHPGAEGPDPVVDWTASNMSAAAIRRECAAREPPIRIPSKLVAKEVKAQYGPILMEQDKNERDSIPRLGRQRSLSPLGPNAQMQIRKKTYHVRDYPSTIQSEYEAENDLELEVDVEMDEERGVEIELELEADDDKQVQVEVELDAEEGKEIDLELEVPEGRELKVEVELVEGHSEPRSPRDMMEE